MAQNVHTGVGQGAVRPSGRSVQLKSFVDYAFVKSGQYKGVDTLPFSDHATASSNGGGMYAEAISLSDNAYASTSPVTHTEVFTESVFGSQRIDTYTESISISDNLSNAGFPVLTHTDSTPFSDSSHQNNPINTDVATISDNTTHP